MSRAILASLAVFALTAACEGASDAQTTAAKRPAGPQDVTGVWEQIDGTLAGRPEREVLEFRADGTYRVHGGGMGAAAEYALDGEVIALKGNHYSFGGVQTFAIDGDVLTITDTVPLPENAPAHLQPLSKITRWSRYDAAPYTPLRDVGGAPVASGLPGLAETARALAHDRNAAVRLVRIDIEQYLPSAYKIEFYLSALDRSGVLVSLQPYHVRVREIAQSYWGERPLPADFLDLPEAVAIASEHGLGAPLRRAELAAWADDGSAHWRLSSQTGAAAVHALSGQIHQGDFSGYAAQLEPDWANALQDLRQTFAQKTGAAAKETCWPTEYRGARGCTTKIAYIRCTSAGGLYRDCRRAVSD